MCGNEEASLTTIKTSQAELDVCSECEELGTQVNTEDSSSSDTKYSTTSSDSNSKSSSNSKNRSNSTSETTPSIDRNTGSDLRMDYGEAIQSARESINLTLAELADEMNEKESHLRGIENENRQPTENLQKELESKLDISLSSETESAEDYESESSGGTTLGDMVDLKD
jgi:uncharacterized protein (TIGR00270 family)